MSKMGSVGRPAGSAGAAGAQQVQPAQDAKVQQTSPQGSAPAAAAANPQQQIDAAKGHAQSAKAHKDVEEGAKQKKLLGSLGQDVKREAGNIGVLGKHFAGRVGEHASALGRFAADSVKHGSVKNADIQREFGKEVAQDFKAAKQSAKKELAPLEKQEKDVGRKGMTADDREKLDRLRQLNKSFKDEPMVIAREMSLHRQDPAYQKMGPAQFASLEVTTRKMLAQNGGERFGLTTMERVGIYGYTTKDFGEINGALRSSGGGPIADPKLQAYVGHINSGLAKLDDFQPQPGQSLYRGVRWDGLPQSVKNNYRPGGQLHDLAFSSTSSNSTAAFSGYDVKCTINNTAGKGGKILPFSAHAGEQEVLFPPGTKFDVVGNTPSQVPGLPPSSKSWTLNIV